MLPMRKDKLEFVDFTSETTEDNEKWHNNIKVLKELLALILYPGKTSIKNEGKIRTFSNKEKLR